MDINQIKFGIEIELTGLRRAHAIRTLHKAVRKHLPIKHARENKIITEDDRIWKIVSDTSIFPSVHINNIETDNGYLNLENINQVVDIITDCEIEIVTPPCTLEDWPVIQTIVRDFKKAGAKTHETCGIHIHVDKSTFEIKDIAALSAMCGEYEKFFNLIFQTHIRRLHYARSMERKYLKYAHCFLKKQISQDFYTMRKAWAGHEGVAARGTRYRGLNLYNYYSQNINTPTVEFRYFNSTLHAGKIRAYLYLVLALSNKDTTIGRYEDIRYKTYNKRLNSYQLDKWLNYLDIHDENVCDHFKKALKTQNYFQ